MHAISIARLRLRERERKYIYRFLLTQRGQHMCVYISREFLWRRGNTPECNICWVRERERDIFFFSGRLLLFYTRSFGHVFLFFFLLFCFFVKPLWRICILRMGLLFFVFVSGDIRVMQIFCLDFRRNCRNFFFEDFANFWKYNFLQNGKYLTHFSQKIIGIYTIRFFF